MSQFKIGDIVVIRDWDDMAREYGLKSKFVIGCSRGFTDSMRYLCGKEFTIKSIDKYYGNVEFEEDSSWHYHIDMIRPVKYKDLDIPSTDLLDSLIFA